MPTCFGYTSAGHATDKIEAIYQEHLTDTYTWGGVTADEPGTPTSQRVELALLDEKVRRGDWVLVGSIQDLGSRVNALKLLGRWVRDGAGVVCTAEGIQLDNASDTGRMGAAVLEAIRRLPVGNRQYGVHTFVSTDPRYLGYGMRQRIVGTKKIITPDPPMRDAQATIVGLRERGWKYRRIADWLAATRCRVRARPRCSPHWTVERVRAAYRRELELREMERLPADAV